MPNPGEEKIDKPALRRFVLAALLITAFAVAVYSNTLSSPFQFDDHMFVIDYNRQHTLGAFWPPFGTRYVTYLSFALNYRFGGLDVTGYHVANLLIHVANGLLVYWFACLLFSAPRMKRDASGVPAFYIAMLAALVFVAHPVQTEAITYISQRFASLATLFYLFSLACYLRWRLSERRGAVVFYALSLASAFVAQETKEISFTLPFVLVFCELAFFEAGKSPARRLLPLLPFLSALAVIPLTLFAGHGGAGIGGEVLSAQVRDLAMLSRHDYLVTQFRVIVTYLRLLVLPVGQNIDYDYPMFRSVFSPQVFASLVFLLAVFGSAVYGFIRSFPTRNAYLRLAAFGVIWFFTTISIESSVIPIKDIIFEHRLYLPSVGAALAFSSFAFWAAGRIVRPQRSSWAAITAVLVVLFCVPLGAAAYARNSVWRSEVTLYEDAARKSPGKERAHYNLAWAYQTKGRTEEAMAEYKAVLRLKPDKEKAHYNLALIYQNRKETDKAIEQFRDALALRPGNAVAWYNLAMLYWDKGDARAAVGAYLNALKIDPMNENAHYNLAWTYETLGETDKAIEHYTQTIRINPASADAHYNLGRIYLKRKMYSSAREEFASALRIDPGFTAARAELEKLRAPR